MSKRSKWGKVHPTDAYYYRTDDFPFRDHSGVSPYKYCNHPPTLVMRGKGGGWELDVGEQWRVKEHALEYDMIVNLTGDSLFFKWGTLIPERYQGLVKYRGGGHEDKGREREIVIDWPNYGIPKLPFTFWEDLYIEMTRHPRVLLFCQGGHGRTGTAVCLLMLVSGAMETAKEAIQWVRENYCEKAVEGEQQQKFIEEFERWLKKK